MKWGIQTRVLILTLVPAMIISLLIGVYFTSMRLHDLADNLKNRGIAIILQVEPASEFGIFSGNKPALQGVMNAALSEPGVRAIAFFDKNQKLIAKAGPEIAEIPRKITEDVKQHHISMEDTPYGVRFGIPVTIGEAIIEDFPDSDIEEGRIESQDKATQQLIGFAAIELDTTSLKLEQYQTLITSSAIVLFGLFISGLFAVRMSRDVTYPIMAISQTVERIREGQYDSRCEINASGELESLSTGINSMAVALQAAHEELQQNIDQATADLRQTLETIEIQNIELELARKDAEAASRVKSEFLANMSHEIRTPLNGILGFLHLLSKSELSFDQRDYLNTINQSASSLLNIINDILDFSKIEAGKLKLENTTFSIRDCMEEAMTLFAPNAYHKGIELVLMVYDDVPEMVLSDALRIKQIATNLISNAVKFTQQGSVVVRVMLEQDEPLQKEWLLRMSITDTGIGLSPEQQKNLFKAFSQGDTSITRKFGGTGLGLVISQKLVEQLGGELGFESDAGEGATFWFTFRVGKIKETHPTHHMTPLLNAHIALYQPHPTAKLALQHLITGWGARVTEIKLPFDAVPECDLTLFDINRDNLVDASFHDNLKQFKETHNGQIGLLINAVSSEAHKIQKRFHGDFYVTKPLARQKLLRQLTDSLGREMPEIVPVLSDTKLAPVFLKINVLAVDDNAANLKLLVILLSQLGVQVTIAHNGQEAIQQVERQSFDLVFMDIQMPEMDGVAATQIIKRLPNGHIPVIALTAHAMAKERERLLKAGMDDYLTKPVNEQSLLRVIQKWIPEDETILSLQTSSQPAIDWHHAKILTGGREDLAKEMLQLLVESLPDTIKELHQAFLQEKWDVMHGVAHKLHGACCYVGVPLLKDAAKNLEMVLMEQAELEIIKEKLRIVEHNTQAVLKEAHAFV